MLNSFSGIGRLGNDPESTDNNGLLTATFSISINEFYKVGGELHKHAHVIPCRAEGLLAEIVMEFLKIGCQVGVRGYLSTRDMLHVEVKDLEFLSM